MASKFNALKQEAELALEKLQGKRYYVGDLANRLLTEASQYRQDTVIQALAGTFEKLANANPNRIISQAEFEEVYSHFVGLNSSGTRCREVLADLFVPMQKPVTTENKHHIAALRDDPSMGQLNYEVDNVVKEQFDKIFAPKLDKYDNTKAAMAGKKVNYELTSLGIDKARVNVVGGNANVIICSADIDTNRGMVRVLIPADASGTQLPSVFFAGNKIETLSKENIRNYISSVVDSRVGLPVATASTIEMPSVELPSSLKAVAPGIEEMVLEASVGYAPESVRLAKKIIVAELSSMGFKGTQVRISEPTRDGFICKATLNTATGKTTIEIPIEMSGQVPLMPSVFASGDFVADFTEVNLKKFAMQNKENDGGFINRDCQLYGMDLHQLKDIIARAAVRGDFDACDEVLEVIAETTNGETYRHIVADYHAMITNIKESETLIKSAYDDSSQFVKTPNSIYPIHKKLGRPAHELVKDASGQYHLKSTYYARQNQEDSGAMFSNAKILVGE
jgi:hypothetical protein